MCGKLLANGAEVVQIERPKWRSRADPRPFPGDQPES